MSRNEDDEGALIVILSPRGQMVQVSGLAPHQQSEWEVVCTCLHPSGAGHNLISTVRRHNF